MSDLIDRQAVLNLFPTHDWKHLYDAIKELPSAETCNQTCNNLQPTCNTRNVLEALDCISRQAAIDAIDSIIYEISIPLSLDEVVGITRDKLDFGIEVLDTVKEDINEVPSAQPDIIRCKDCKRWCNDFPFNYCTMNDRHVEEWDFCSWAERKTNE